MILQKLIKLAEERMRLGEANIQGRSFRVAVHYIDTALMVFKVLYAKNMVKNWNLGKAFLLRAEASFTIALGGNLQQGIHSYSPTFPRAVLF